MFGVERELAILCFIGLVELVDDSVSEDVSPGVSDVLGDRDCMKLWYLCSLLTSGESSCDVARVTDGEGPSRGGRGERMGEEGTTGVGDTSPGAGVMGEEGTAGMDGTSPRAGVMGEEVTTEMGGTWVIGEVATQLGGPSRPPAPAPSRGVIEVDSPRRGDTSRMAGVVVDEGILAGVRENPTMFILNGESASELLLVEEVCSISPSLSLEAHWDVDLLYWLLQVLLDLLVGIGSGFFLTIL